MSKRIWYAETPGEALLTVIAESREDAIDVVIAAGAASAGSCRLVRVCDPCVRELAAFIGSAS